MAKERTAGRARESRPVRWRSSCATSVLSSAPINSSTSPRTPTVCNRRGSSRAATPLPSLVEGTGVAGRTPLPSATSIKGEDGGRPVGRAAVANFDRLSLFGDDIGKPGSTPAKSIPLREIGGPCCRSGYGRHPVAVARPRCWSHAGRGRPGSGRTMLRYCCS